MKYTVSFFLFVCFDFFINLLRLRSLCHRAPFLSQKNYPEHISVALVTCSFITINTHTLFFFFYGHYFLDSISQCLNYFVWLFVVHLNVIASFHT